MNDKEAFEKWFYLLGDSHLERVIKLNRGSSYEAWRAACEYKQQKINAIDCYIERDEKIKKLKAENAKLRECVKFLSLIDYQSSIIEEGKDFFTIGDKLHSTYHENRMIIEEARQVLKELEDK